MSDASNIPFDPSDPEQQGRFRYFIAGFLKFLILARARTDDKFWTEKIQQSWWDTQDGDVVPDLSKISALILLRDTRQRRRHFDNHYIGYNESICDPDPDASAAEVVIENLRELVASFVSEDSIGLAIQQFKDRQDVPWDTLAEWHQLDNIRQQLNLLPHPTGAEDRDGPVPPLGFRYQGKEKQGCRPTAWRLINHLWSKTHHIALLDQLAHPVWGDEDTIVEGNNFGSARREANKFFKEHGIPFAIEKQPKSAYCSLVAREWPAVEKRPIRKSKKK